jgi:hypothetical protein
MNGRLGRSTPDRIRVLARGAAGLAMASAGERTCARLGSGEPRAASIAARALAARHLAEAFTLARHGTTRTRRAIAVVDGLHAVSMVALAAVRRDERRPALLSAAITAGLMVTLR